MPRLSSLALAAAALALASNPTPISASSRGLRQMVAVPLGGTVSSLGAGNMVLAGTAPVPRGGVQSFLEKRAAKAAKHPRSPEAVAAAAAKDELAPLANDAALAAAPRGAAPNARIPSLHAIPPVAPASIPGGMAQMQVVRLPDPRPPPQPKHGPGARRGGPGSEDANPAPQAAGDAAVVGGDAGASPLPAGAAETLAAYARANGGTLPPGITAPAGVDVTDPVALGAALAAGNVNNSGGKAGEAAAAGSPTPATNNKKRSPPLKSPGVILALVLAGAAAAGAAAAAVLSVATTLSHRRKAREAEAAGVAAHAAAVAAAAVAEEDDDDTPDTSAGDEAGAAGLTTPLRSGLGSAGARRAALMTPGSDVAQRTIDRAL